MGNKICVYAICKNELAFIDKWLENMSEADYIVVLDTGSTDGTYEKLKSDPRVYKVEQKIINPWRFDVARNESLKLVPDDANILLSTDFDELFTTPGWGELIKANWDERNCNRMYYQYAWSHNEAGEPTDIFKYDKIHSRDFHWIFPVHEVLWPNDNLSTSDVKFIDLEGYVKLEHFQDVTKPRSNYMELLKLAVKENPQESHVRMLLAREYLLASDYENALKHYLAVIDMPDSKSELKKTVLLESINRAGDCQMMLKNYKEALWNYTLFITIDPTHREPYLNMADIYNTLGCYTLAEEMITAAIRYGVRHYDWIEQADSWISRSEDLMSVVYYNTKRYKEALMLIDYCLKHHPGDERLLKNKQAIEQALHEQNA